MKLIIDIPEEDYEFTKDAKTARVFPSEYYVKLILNGTSLDDLKTKIATYLSWDMFDEYGNKTVLHKELMEILDNIGKAEISGCDNINHIGMLKGENT